MSTWNGWTSVPARSVVVMGRLLSWRLVARERVI
jgi:hypothetical protein